MPSQRSNAQRVRSSCHNFTKENTDKCIMQKLRPLLRACFQNEVTGIHKFYREILFIGTFYVSFSYELRASNFKALENRKWRCFFAFDRCEDDANRHNQPKEPIRTRSKYILKWHQARENTCRSTSRFVLAWEPFIARQNQAKSNANWCRNSTKNSFNWNKLVTRETSDS